MKFRNPFSRRPQKSRGTPRIESGYAPPKRMVQPRRSYPTYRSSRQRSRWGGLKRLLGYGAIAGGLFLGWLYITLPDIHGLNVFTKTPSILIKSEDGQIIGSSGDIYGEYIPFDALPQSLVDAVVATEDRNFYHHFGIDPLGLLRAAYADLRARHVVQGGSTITQQVAKNVFLTPERSLTRKLREMMLALEIERHYSKQEILSIYMNRVYLGAGNYGVDAAARRYFGKSARDLTLSESAIIAGLLKAPSRFAPTANPQLAKARADQVLLNMQDAGYLTERQARSAREALAHAMSNRVKTAQSTFYFSDWILDQIPEFVGNVQEDLVVTTTLKPQWQLMAEKAIAGVMDKEGADHDASQAALIAMTPDGAIRVMIGGRSYGQSQYNRATQSLRPPGSAFKLFVYLAGLESGFHPDTMVDDHPIRVPVAGGSWEPKNYTGRYLGPMPLKEAVTESINTVAVQVAMQAGLPHVIDVARRLGITSDLEEVPSIALGSTGVSLLELTGAYAHLAAGGAIVNPFGIVEIDNAQGQPLYRREGSPGGAVLSAGVVGEMNEMLESVIENGTGKAARIGRPVAGKTGTTSDYRDAWFEGFVPQLATGVWVGNDDNSEMKRVTGGMLPAMIWHDFMISATAGMPVENIYTGGWWPFSGPARGAQPFPEQPGAQEHPLRKRESHGILGPSFWNKLFR